MRAAELTPGCTITLWGASYRVREKRRLTRRRQRVYLWGGLFVDLSDAEEVEAAPPQ